MSTNQKPNIGSFIDKNISNDKCLFYRLWLKEMSHEILKTELKVKRRGLPKAGARPMVRNKQFLALVKTFNKYKLKDFAENFGVSYDVAKVWNREKLVMKQAKVNMLLFAGEYVSKLEEWSFSDEMDFTKVSIESYKNISGSIDGLLQEAKYYNPDIQWLIFKLIKNKSELEAERSFMWNNNLLTFINVLQERDIFNPPKNPKLKIEFEQYIALLHRCSTVLTEDLFDRLKESILKNKLEQAFKVADLLKDGMSENIKENAVLKISVLNKGKKRGSEDLDKLYKEAAERQKT